MFFMADTQTYGEWIRSVMEEKGLTPIVCCRRALDEHGKPMQHSQWNALMEDEPKKANNEPPQRSGKVAKRVALALGVSENASRLAAGLGVLKELPDANQEYIRSKSSQGEVMREPNDLSFEPDEDEEEIISYYRGMSEIMQPAALSTLKAMYEADRKRLAEQETHLSTLKALYEADKNNLPKQEVKFEEEVSSSSKQAGDDSIQQQAVQGEESSETIPLVKVAKDISPAGKTP